MKKTTLSICTWVIFVLGMSTSPVLGMPNPPAVGTSSQAPSTIDFAIQTPEGVFGASMNCYSFNNDGVSILLIHGANHNKATYNEWLGELAKKQQTFHAIKQACAIDLPGHGDSSLGDSVFLSKLGLDAYINFVRNLLVSNIWEESGLERPTKLVGHSLGGLLIQLLWQDIPDNEDGDDIRAALAPIDSVLLLAPTLPREVYWSTGDINIHDMDPGFMLEVVRMMAFRVDLGLHVNFPPTLFSNYFLTCEPENGVSTPVEARDVESLQIWLEIYGYFPDSSGEMERPSVEAGTFADINLVTLSFQDDPYMNQTDIQNLHRHLKGLDPVDPLPSNARHAGNNPEECLPHDAFYVNPAHPDIEDAVYAFLELPTSATLPSAAR